MKILLVGNYVPDAQESMQRFAELLERELKARGHEVRLLRPTCKLNKRGAPPSGAAKWVGYLDKFVLFPRELRAAVGDADVVHVCDHSNATYVRALGRTPHLVTCHDMLAIRSGLGQVPENPTGWSGRILQRYILSGLKAARNIACVSGNSRRELLEVTGLPESTAHVVYNGLNYPYSPMPDPEASARMARLLDAARVDRPDDKLPSFIFHVGGNQWYKNRLGVLRAYQHMVSGWNSSQPLPLLVMAGKPFPEALKNFVAEHQLQDRVVSIQGADNEDLRALFSKAELMVFPSLAEGFGWPIIEAQACGCRVVTMDLAPMNEISSDAALLCDVNDISALTARIMQLLQEQGEARQARIRAGIANADRFTTAKMVEEYLDLYRALAANAASH
jgi:glycosyltransferase involved in cell wall biosynthesis